MCLFLQSYRDYTDDTVMMQPVWLTVTILIISVIIGVVLPYLRDKAEAEEKERLARIMKYAHIQDDNKKRTISQETKNKRIINNFADHCIVYKHPTAGTRLLSIINERFVIITDNRYIDCIINHIETNNPERVFAATSFFVESHCPFFSNIDFYSIFENKDSLPYIKKKHLRFDDNRLALLPYLLELDSLSTDIELKNPYTYRISGDTSIIQEYLSYLGDRAWDICTSLPNGHNKRKASQITNDYILPF